MSKARYNPTFDRDKRGEGKAFNQEPAAVMEEITDEQRRESAEKVEILIQHAQKQLGLRK